MFPASSVDRHCMFQDVLEPSKRTRDVNTDSRPITEDLLSHSSKVCTGEEHSVTGLWFMLKDCVLASW